jgi:DNA-binding NarL/FixJ family response regulator
VTGAPLYVLPTSAATTPVVRRLVREGWAVRDGFHLPDHPWDVAAGRLVLTGTVSSGPEVADAVLAAARGAGLVAVADPAGPEGHAATAAARDLIADLARIGLVRTSAEAEPAGSGLGPLTAEQAALLARLAAGESIAGAAEAEFLSLRTANRRIAAARAALGVGTTRQAVIEFVRLRGGG